MSQYYNIKIIIILIKTRKNRQYCTQTPIKQAYLQQNQDNIKQSVNTQAKTKLQIHGLFEHISIQKQNT